MIIANRATFINIGADMNNYTIRLVVLQMTAFMMRIGFFGMMPDNMIRLISDWENENPQ